MKGHNLEDHQFTNILVGDIIDKQHDGMSVDEYISFYYTHMHGRNPYRDVIKMFEAGKFDKVHTSHIHQYTELCMLNKFLDCESKKDALACELKVISLLSSALTICNISYEDLHTLDFKETKVYEKMIDLLLITYKKDKEGRPFYNGVHYINSDIWDLMMDAIQSDWFEIVNTVKEIGYSSIKNNRFDYHSRSNLFNLKNIKISNKTKEGGKQEPIRFNLRSSLIFETLKRL